MYYVTKIDRDAATVPTTHAGHSRGYSRQALINRSTGSPHMSVSVGRFTKDGYVDATVHSHELSFYILSGEIAVSLLGSTTLLNQDHCLVIPVGVTYSLRAVSDEASWLLVSAPSEIDDGGRRQDTFFTGEVVGNEANAAAPDIRDPRNQHAVLFDSGSMDMRRLVKGSDVEAPSVSPSMATALLAYSGIGVRMLIDQRVGAQLHTMFMVDYQPTAIAHPHDHPFEETYVFVEGETHALVDGNELVLHPGDVLWAGVGADHGFENRGTGLVRWIEMQAPQPPAQHSYRFSRDWEYLGRKLAGES
jgi:quercetin dioxygenase-like cupin family protein